MKGLVVDHKKVSDSHICSYAFAEGESGNNTVRGQVSDFGVLSQQEDSIKCEVKGAEMVRKCLKTTLDKDSSEFIIYNYSDFKPQLEISRLPHDMRELAYEYNKYRVKGSASQTFAHTGQFLASSTINFISTNFCRFDSPISTNRKPRSQGTDNVDYYLYTDASYHPNSNKTGISIVIIGKNGGLYAFGQRVNPQVISRAELLAFILGVRTIKEIKDNAHILAHTDSKDVSMATENEIIIDKRLQEELEKYISSGLCVDVNCISREANQFADAMAKIGRSEGQIKIGRLTSD